MDFIVLMYVTAIESGRLTIEFVPKRWRQAVEEALSEEE